MFQDACQESQEISSKCTKSVKSVGTETDLSLLSTTKELKTQATQTDTRDFEPADVCMKDVSSVNPANKLPVQQIKQEPGTIIEPQRREISRRGNKIQLHPCPYCSKAFTSPVFLKKHIKCHSIETLSQANSSGSPTGFTSPEKVEILDESKESVSMEDMTVEPEDNVGQCFQCDKKFASAEALDKHFILHYDDVHCYGCNKTFGSTKSYKAHLYVHFGEKYRCRRCPKKYAIKVGLLRHIKHNHRSLWNAKQKADLLQLESEVRPIREPDTTIEPPPVSVHFNCDECNVGFGLYSELVSHQENCKKPQEKSTSSIDETSQPVFSKKKKKYRCNTCDLYYSSLKSLLRHKRISRIHKLNSFQGPEIQKQNLSKSESCVHDNNKSNPVSHVNDNKSNPMPHVQYNSRILHCIDCSSSFETYESLKHHRKSRVCPNTNKLENNKYRCLYCPEICVSRIQQTRHLVTHIPINGDGVFPCNQCTKQFKDKRMLEKHVYYHLSMLPCNICNMKFPKFADLKRHENKMHYKSTSKPFTCTICNKKFGTSQSLTNHSKTHNKGAAGACTVCGKAFTYGRNLRVHMKKCKRKAKVAIPQETGALQGQTVESSYANTQEMSMDLQTDESNVLKEIKKEVCNDDVSFFHDNDMNNNNNNEETNQSKEHTSTSNCPNLRLRKSYNYSANPLQLEYIKKENKFQCSTCRLFYSSRYALIRHQDLKRHGDRCGKGIGKRFKCKPCNKSFHLYSVFYQHQRKHHSQNKSQCKKCGLSFSSSKLLSFHKCIDTSTSSSPHGSASNQHECHMCKATFPSGTGLSNHMRSHLFQAKEKIWECKCCKKIFENEKRLRKHRRSEAHSENVLKQKNNEEVGDEKRFECCGCGKYYKSNKLLLKHRSNSSCKALQGIHCPSCNKIFQSYPAFVQHHESAHDGGKPCWLCGKSFSNFGNLNRHIRDLHKDAKKLICIYCSKEFNSMSSYTMHNGSNADKHCCKFCDASFSSCVYLTEHISTHHST